MAIKVLTHIIIMLGKIIKKIQPGTFYIHTTKFAGEKTSWAEIILKG